MRTVGFPAVICTLVALASLCGAGVTFGQHGSGGLHRHILRAADYDAHTYVAPVIVPAGKSVLPAADITVTYTGFSEPARQAFEHAVALWEQHLTSPVTIHVEASFEPLEDDVLGSAGPRITANFSQLALSSTWYPTALADAIVGRNVDTGGADISASFNSDFPNWYFGIDGRPPSGQYDFVTVVMHELGHGLGFTGSFDVENDDSDENECPTEIVGYGCWGLTTTSGRNRYPLIYDRFVEDAAEVPLLDTNTYPNPSLELGDVLRSGAVFFDGDAVRIVNQDIPVDLYAPENFERGSSFSHLDEKAFPPGDPNSLMTPLLGRAEAIHSPGAVTCAILQDLGWPLGDACLALFFAGITSATVDATADGGIVSFQVHPLSNIDSVVVEIRAASGDFRRAAVVNVDPFAGDLQTYEVLISDLEPGRYVIRLRIVDVDNFTLPGPELSLVIPLEAAFRLDPVWPNPTEGDVANVSLMVRDVQRVSVDVMDALGRRVQRGFARMVSDNEEVQLTLDLAGLVPGVYFVHVRGERFASTVRFVRTR